MLIPIDALVPYFVDAQMDWITCQEAWHEHGGPLQRVRFTCNGRRVCVIYDPVSGFEARVETPMRTYVKIVSECDLSLADLERFLTKHALGD